MEGNKNQAKIVAAVAVFIVVVTAVVGIVMLRQEEELPSDVLQASQRLEESYAQSIALGLPMTQDQLFAGMQVPDDENAALVILPLCEKLDPIPRAEDSYDPLDVARERTPELIQQLADSKETLDALVKATGLPGWFVEHDYDEGPFVKFREYAELKKASKLLVARSIDHALKGDEEAALADLLASRRLGEYMRRTPAWIGVSVSMAIDAIALRGAERLAEIWHSQTGTLSSLQDTLARSRFEVDPISALRGDFYMGLATGRNLDLFGGMKGWMELSGEDWEMPVEPTELRRDGLPPEDMERAYMNGHLEIWNAVFAEVLPDPSLLRSSGEYIDQNFGEDTIPSELHYLLVAMTLLDFGGVDKALSRSDARRDLIDALLEVLVHRAENGVLPASLLQLRAEVADPFGQGKAVQYKADGDTVMIWSVGPDGVDDNGDGDDLAVRYPMTK